jgi:heme A synthase
MDTNRISQGEMIAAIAALLLLIVMFIFTWFSLDLGDTGNLLTGVDTGVNAWQAFGFIDIVLFVTILVAVGGALIAANATSVNTPVAVSAITAGLGILSFLLILYRIIDPPGSGDIPDAAGIGISRGIGVWLGLILAAAIAYGGWRAMEDEGISIADQADRFRGGGGAAPPPPPPPPTGTGGSAPPPAS